MSVPKVDTIHKWVDARALSAYADKLKANAESIAMRAWPREQTPEEEAAIRMLGHAEQAARLASALGAQAVRMANDVAYARIYGR